MNADGTGTRRADVDEGGRLAPDVVSRRRARSRSLGASRATSSSMNADGSDARRISDIRLARSRNPPGRPTANGSRTSGGRPATPRREVWLMRPDGTGSRSADIAAARAASRRPGRPTARGSCSRANVGASLYDALHDRRRRKATPERRADGRRQLRAVVVARRDEDRLPGGRRDLHGRARQAATSRSSPTTRTTTRRRPGIRSRLRATSSSQNVP